LKAEYHFHYSSFPFLSEVESGLQEARVQIEGEVESEAHSSEKSTQRELYSETIDFPA
jgi:hypothetical protein